MRTGWLRSYWLEATEALPWTGRGKGGGGRLSVVRPALGAPGSAAHRATRSCPTQAPGTPLRQALRSRLARRLGLLGGLLRLLLEGAHLGQRRRAGDVRDRSPGALLAVLPRRLPPARRRDAVLLAEQRQEDLRLLRTEAGQLAQPAEQCGAVRDVGPYRIRAAVVALDQQAGELLGPGGHRARVTVQRRWSLEVPLQHLRVALRQLRGGQGLDAEPVGQQPRCAERALHRELLVQQHADQEGQRVAGEQLVGGVVLGDVKGRHTEMVP